MDPNTMTLDECRDWLAGDDGWSWVSRPVQHIDMGNHRNSFTADVRFWSRGDVKNIQSHPCPPTIDAIAACMPEGWYWWINHCAIFGVETYVTKAVQKSAPLLRAESQAESELLARARLAVACRMAAKGEGR